MWCCWIFLGEVKWMCPGISRGTWSELIAEKCSSEGEHTYQVPVGADNGSAEDLLPDLKQQED